MNNLGGVIDKKVAVVSAASTHGKGFDDTTKRTLIEGLRGDRAAVENAVKVLVSAKALESVLFDGHSTPLGYTPLLFCAGSHLLAMTLLIEAGADVNARSSNGETPLILACVAGSEKNPSTIVKLLKNSKTDVNAKDKNGDTALHHVALAGWTAGMDLLVADPRLDHTLENNHHETAKKFAIRKDFIRMVDALNRLEKKKGATNTNTASPASTEASNTSAGGINAAEYVVLKKLVKYLGKVVADGKMSPQTPGNIREMMSLISDE